MEFHGEIIQAQNEERFRGYFYNRDYLYEEYKEICELAGEQPCGNIGLAIDEGTWEYPIWAQLYGQAGYIRHIMIENETSAYEDINFIPDYIVSSREPEDVIYYHDAKYCLQEECRDNCELWFYSRCF